MGQLQTSQIELEALCARLAPVFLEYLRTHGTAIDRVEVASSLDGITTLPARYSLGGVEKNVLAPLSLLTKGVDEAIDECAGAAANAQTAANNADVAAGKAQEAAADLNEVKGGALRATTAANEAAETARIKSVQLTLLEQKLTDTDGLVLAAENERKANESARISAEEARATAEAVRVSNETTRKSNESSRVSAENSRKIAENSRNSQVKTAVDSANAAAKTANDAAAALQGAQWYVPTRVSIKCPIEIYDDDGNLLWEEGFVYTLGHRRRDTVFHPLLRVYPDGARPNVILKEESYMEDGRSVMEVISYTNRGHDETGIEYLYPYFYPRRPGTCGIWIVPVDNTSVYSIAQYAIFPTAMRLSGGGAWRGNGKGRLRLTKNKYKRLGFRLR